MDAARHTEGQPSFREDETGAHWAGARASERSTPKPARPTGTVLGLLAMATLGFVMVAQAAVDLSPRRPPAPAPTPAAVTTIAATPQARPAVEQPLAVLPDPERTDNGLAVEPWRWPNPLTVSESTPLRAAPGDLTSEVRGTATPGRPIRVIGRVKVDEDTIWLQIRTDNGGVAYVDGERVMEETAYRARERAAAQRAREEAQAAAESTAPTDLSTFFGASNSQDVPPSEATPAPEPGQLY